MTVVRAIARPKILAALGAASTVVAIAWVVLRSPPPPPPTAAATPAFSVPHFRTAADERVYRVAVIEGRQRMRNALVEAIETARRAGASAVELRPREAQLAAVDRELRELGEFTEFAAPR